MKRALVILDRDFRGGQAQKGNRRRIIALIRCLRALGYRVAFVVPAGILLNGLAEPEEPVFEVSVRPFMGGPLGAFDASPYGPAVAAAAAEFRPDVALAEYVWLGPCLAHVPPECVRIVDTHDVFHRRCVAFLAVGADPWVSCDPEEEGALLGWADVTLAIQEDEARVLRAALPERIVETVPYTLPLRPEAAGGSAGLCAMFVGSDHAGNLGIAAFATQVWPAVRRRVPGARLAVYGSIARRLEPQPGVDLIGPVEDLVARYDAAALVVCPIAVGSGLKVKTVEALAHGRTVVGTAEAFAGMPEPEEPAWALAEGWREQAGAVVRLLVEPERRWGLERAAVAYATRHYAGTEAESALARGIERARAVRRGAPLGALVGRTP